MTIFSSISARRLNNDPLPWTLDGVHVAYADIGRLPYVDANVHYAPRVEYTPQTAHKENPILDSFRDMDTETEYLTGEWLFQLSRHWAQWQSARIGTFPIDYRDPSGPADKAESQDSGEDGAYWEIDNILRDVLERHGGVITENPRDTSGEYEWIGITRAGDAVQDVIVHATKVLARLYAMYEARDSD